MPEVRINENGDRHPIIEIQNIDIPELAVYVSLKENQLRHYYEPEGGIFIAETALVVERALDAGCQPISLLLAHRQLKGEGAELIRRCGDIPVYTAADSVLQKLTGFPLTRGVLCAMRRPALPSPKAICAGASRIVVLENVMNPTNVGAIFRSAAALNMDGVLLTSACSDPLYRRAIRVSMGTVFQIPWTVFEGKNDFWPEQGIRFLREQGFITVAMALREDSVGIDAPELHSAKKLALVLGTEGDGLAAETIAGCDYTVKIPMSHGVDSLNVAAASAVAFWELGKK